MLALACLARQGCAMAQAEVISVEQDVSVEEELPFMVLSFIEVAVHGLLWVSRAFREACRTSFEAPPSHRHARQVYPNRRNENMAARKFTVHDHHAWVPHAELFERRRAYGCAVWMSRHPELNDYIHKALFKAKAFMDAVSPLSTLFPSHAFVLHLCPFCTGHFSSGARCHSRPIG